MPEKKSLHQNSAICCEFAIFPIPNVLGSDFLMSLMNNK